MSDLSVNKNSFSRTFAHLENVHPISEYSVTVDREVLNDRTHARYLVKENIRDHVYFDLKKGIDTFIDKCDTDLIKNEGRLHPLCTWACAQEGDDLKKIFSGAKFAGRRGTMKTIATTICTHNSKFDKAWTVTAVKTNGVILLCESSLKYSGDKLSHYVGSKFEQYMTKDKPDGEADTDAPVDTRPAFKMIIRSDIACDGDSLAICCAAEIDALDGESPVELKTRPTTNPLPFFKSLDVVLQSELADVHQMVLGLKNNDIVQEVKRYRIQDLKINLKRDDEKCLAFLFKVLRSVETMLATKDACEIKYVPERGLVKFTEFPKKDAMDLLTPEFKEKFNLGD